VKTEHQDPDADADAGRQKRARIDDYQMRIKALHASN
jgi:hypothetical protein